MNVFVAITLAAFIVSAVPSVAHAFQADAKSQIVHSSDVQKADGKLKHQKDTKYDNGCCISHCFCAAYAMSDVQLSHSELVFKSVDLIFFDTKTVSISSAPQLRPPRTLA